MFKSKQEKEIATVKHFEAGLIVALKEQDEAKAEFSEALAASVSGEPLALERLNKARRLRDLANSRVADAEEGVRIMKAKYAEACKAEYLATVRKHWNETKDLAQRRIVVAKELEADLNSVADKFNILKDLSLQVYNKAPTKDTPLHASLLSLDRLTEDFRLNLRRLGFDWAISYPWGAHTIPPLSETVANSSGWIVRDAAKLDEEKPTNSPEKNALGIVEGV